MPPLTLVTPHSPGDPMTLLTPHSSGDLPMALLTPITLLTP